jgi:DNA mismatch repair protein MutS2
MKEIFDKQEYSQSDLVKMSTLKNKIGDEKYNLDKNEDKFVPFKPCDINTLKVDDEVYVKSLDDTAKVIEINVKKNTCWVLVGAIRINVKISDIFFVSKNNSNKNSASISIKRESQLLSKPEINVIGLNLEEALDKCEKFIDSSILNNFEEVKIIHGKGQKILSTGIQKMLKSHKGVESYRFGKYGEGEHGVTIIKLK